MDGRMFTYIFGMTAVLIGVVLILKIATTAGSKNPWSINKKILFGVIALALLGNGLYDLLHTGSGRYHIDDDHWTNKNQVALVKKCLSDAATLTQQYPDVMQTYCECSIAKITENMTYKEYLANMSKPQDEQLKQIVPIIQQCYEHDGAGATGS